MLFKDFNINSNLKKALKELNYIKATPIQIKAIPELLQGKDLIGYAQTGSGKTGAFAIPILEKLSQYPEFDNKSTNINALVLVPTRELALQISESFQSYGSYLDIITVVIYGGVSIKRQIKALKKEPQIIIATPGRLIDLVNKGYINLKQLDMFVLDEVDHMLDLGMFHEVQIILKLLPQNRQNIFISATESEDLNSIIDEILKNPVMININNSQNNSLSIKEKVYFVDQAYKLALLLKILEQDFLSSVLIFTKTKRSADRINKTIIKAGIKSKSIHSDKTQQARQSALNMFKTNKIRVLVATDIAARGIDINKITHVINFDIPQSPKQYIHRIGRTGRKSDHGVAINLCSLHEVEFLQAIEEKIGYELKEVKDHNFLPLTLAFVRDRHSNKPLI